MEMSRGKQVFAAADEPVLARHYATLQVIAGRSQPASLPLPTCRLRGTAGVAHPCRLKGKRCAVLSAGTGFRSRPDLRVVPWLDTPRAFYGLPDHSPCSSCGWCIAASGRGKQPVPKPALLGFSRAVASAASALHAGAPALIHPGHSRRAPASRLFPA